MNFNFKIGDLVKVSREAVESNGANLDMDYDELYLIAKQRDIGEPAYTVRGVETNSKVYMSGDTEYHFIDEELVLVCSYHE